MWDKGDTFAHGTFSKKGNIADFRLNLPLTLNFKKNDLLIVNELS